MLKACIKLLVWGIVLFIGGTVGLAALELNGYDISDVSIGGSSTDSIVMDEGITAFTTYIADEEAVSELNVTQVSDKSEYGYVIDNFENAEDITSIKVNIRAGSFIINSSNRLSISCTYVNDDYFDYSVADNCLTVSYMPKVSLSNFNFETFSFDEAQIVIDLPQKVYENAEFSVTAGELIITSLVADNLSVDFSAGESVLQNVRAESSADIVMTAGECTFESCTFNNMAVKMTAGDMYILHSEIPGVNNVKMTAGNLNMELLGKRDDYNISVDRTAGEVYIDGDYTKGMEKASGSYENELDINITAGECNVSFYEY